MTNPTPGSVRNLLTLAQVLEILGVKSRQVVYRAVKHGTKTPGGVVKLAAICVGNKMKFHELDVATYLSALTDKRMGKDRPRTAIDPPSVKLVPVATVARFPESGRPKGRKRHDGAANGLAHGVL